MVLAKSTPSEENNNLTLQDQVRLYLGSFNQREVPTTVKDMAKALKQPQPSVYQVINLLRQRNEIDVRKEPLPNGREKIVGIKINKLAPSGRIYRKAAERSGRVQRIKPMIDSIVPSEENLPDMSHIIEYLHKKLAIEDMKARALKAGLSEANVTFDPEPLAEEAILLLKAFTELQKKYDALVEDHKMQGFDLQAEKRNVESLESRIRQKTNEMLGVS